MLGDKPHVVSEMLHAPFDKGGDWGGRTGCNKATCGDVARSSLGTPRNGSAGGKKSKEDGVGRREAKNEEGL